MTDRLPFTPADHDRALELSAVRVDEALPADDEAWVARHLSACEDCAETAAAYEADHELFAGLRAFAPQPPRDLWARTAAAIEAERPRRARRRFGAPRPSPRFRLAPLAAVVAVVVIVGAGLLNGGTMLPGGGPGPTPIALTAEAVQVITRDTDGTVRILTRPVDEVCPVGVSSCGVSPTFAVAAMSGIDGTTDVQGALNPQQDRMVVVARDAGGEGVYVLPVRTAAATPVPTTPASATATVSGKPAGTTAPAGTPGTAAVATPTAPVETGSPAPATTAPATTAPATTAPATTAPATTEPSTAVPASSAPATPSAPVVTTAPTTAPDATPTPVASADATPSPAATDTASPAPTSEAASTPPASGEPLPSIDVTPSPDPNAPIQIASGVSVLGTPVYAPDGQHLAFAAMPSDGSTGPDIYVWSAGDATATPITSDHGAWLAGWTADGIVISRAADGVPASYLLDAATGESTPFGAPGAWLPVIAPNGHLAVWWSGTVALAEDGVTLVPDEGRLVIGAWPNASTGPDVQVLAKRRVAAWQARWSEAGDAVAVWTDPSASGHSGRLSLYGVDAATGAADLASPMLDDAPANPDFSLRTGRLAWTASSAAVPQAVEVLAWSGQAIGRLTIPADGSGTVVP